MDLQKKSFIDPGKSCPHWLKITLWNELGRLVQKYRIKKNIFPNLFSNIFKDVISYMVVIDTMIDNIGNKLDNLRLQGCCLKNRPFWKWVISPEKSFFNPFFISVPFMDKPGCWFLLAKFLKNTCIFTWNI